MKKDLFMLVVVMIAALAVASMLSQRLLPMQYEITKEKALLTTAPLGGNQKFAADVQWMRFINYLGNLSTVDDTNTAMVEKWIENLMKLDPNFAPLYQDGVLSISKSNPQKAIEFLERACEVPHLKNNWQIPFYAGFIYARPTYDIKDQNKLLMDANQQKAADFFQMALERSVEKPENYIVNSYIRAKAKSIMKGNAPDREYYAKLKVLYDEWLKDKNMSQPMFDPSNPNAMPPEAGMGRSLIPDIQKRLLAAAQDAKKPKDYDDNPVPVSPETLKLIDQIQKDVLAGQNLCENCLYPSAAGEKFCSHCGKELKRVWGTCPKCDDVLKPGAKFCSSCGFDTTKFDANAVKKQVSPAPAK